MHSKIKQVGLGVAALTGAAVGGAAVADAATAHSATSTTIPAPQAAHPPPGLKSMPAPGTAAHEEHEKAVTGDAAQKAQAAAVKAAGGGTAGDVTTDYFGTGYEVTVTKTDGSKAEYHLDSSFAVMRPPAGPGGGPPAPSGSGN